ncbi:MAG: outer membrane protein OmpU [Pelagibacterales bacterium]|nr:outer membrane protein OmpU [Pelagibacterales bacterium]
MNIRKIGLTALAGSMVALSAHAVDMSVSGSTEMTYVSTDGNSGSNNTGSPLGMNTSLSFSGSGDVGIGTLNLTRTINDGLAGFLSMWNTLDMGDAGIISFDSSGGDHVGISANDDKLPTAYEETWNGTSAPLSGISSNNVIGYQNTFGIASVSMGYAIANGNGNQGDQGGTGDGASGSASDVYITITPNDMITAGVGRFSAKDNSGVSTTADVTQTLAQANVTIPSSPLSFGVMYGESNGGTVGTKNTKITAASIAFVVNENFSVSYGVFDTDYLATSGGATVTEGVSAFNLSYTMGSAKIGAQWGESKNDGGVTGLKDKNMDIGLSFSF